MLQYSGNHIQFYGDVVMKEFDVELESIDETIIYGIWMKSNDKTISKDIQKLSKEYYEVVSKNQGGPSVLCADNKL